MVFSWFIFFFKLPGLCVSTHWKLTLENIISSIFLVGCDKVGTVDGWAWLELAEGGAQLILDGDVKNSGISTCLSNVLGGDIPTWREKE